MSTMKLLSTIRSNWKKTIFGLVVGAYGVNYGYETYQISSLMKAYSEKAVLHGDQCDAYPKKLIVILNPAANKKKAEKIFTKYCEPILHLAGYTVDIVRTDSENFAKTYVEQLKTAPYGIVVAGGDGSISEVLTGLMRRNIDRCPVALLPLGRKNETTKRILPLDFSSKVKQVETLLNATLNITREQLEKRSVFKIEQIATEEDEQQVGKPIYSLGSIEWGVYRDIDALRSKYWYFWKADKYVSALMNAFNSALSWDCKADVCYTTPCKGCKKCILENEVASQSKKNSMFSSFFSRQQVLNAGRGIQLSAVECEDREKQINASNIRIYVDEQPQESKLVLESDEKLEKGFESFSKYLSEERAFELLKFRTMNFIPDQSCTGPSKLYSIDGEDYDVRAIKVTLIPKAIEIFT